MELLGPPDEHLLWLKPLAFAAKTNTHTHTMICCGLNKTRYCIVQCVTALWSSFLVSHVLFTLYFACQIKHSQFLQEVAVETHPCRKPVCPVRSFCSVSFSARFKTTTFCLQCTANSLSHWAPCLHRIAPN